MPSLQALIDAGHAMMGVLCQPDRPAGRGRELKPGPVKQLAMRAGIPVSQPATLKTDDERSALREWAPDVLVVAAYGLILPAAALAIPRLGCINVHASLLPRWRGAAPIQRAILAGDAQTGVCIMRMAAGLDTGPVFGPVGRRCLPIDDTVSAGELEEQLALLGARALIDTLVQVETGTGTLEEQSTEGITYASKIRKAEAQIDWRLSASQVARQVRAFNPWPVAQTLWEGQVLRVWEASSVLPAEDAVSAPDALPGQVLSLHGERLLVQCGDGRLALTRVQLPGRRVVSAREFAGQRSLASARLG